MKHIFSTGSQAAPGSRQRPRLSWISAVRTPSVGLQVAPGGRQKPRLSWISAVHIPSVFQITALFITLGIKAAAQSGPGAINRKTLLEQALAPVTVEDIRMDQITFAPGQAAPEHYHPCEVYGYVVSGQIIYQLAGQAPVTLHAGNSFREPAGRRVTMFKNALSGQSSTFIAIYLAKKDQPVTVLSNNAKTH